MSTAVAVRESQEAELIERLVIDGDIGKLGAADRLTYYYAMCRRAGLDPLSQPLEYLKLNGKTVLYFKRASTDQIASNRKLSRRIVRAEMVGNVYLVVAECSDATGRVEQSTGAVSVAGLSGEALCNAMLKAESKGKRRSVLSFTGMGFMDEGDADSIPGAERLDIASVHGTNVNTVTGEVLDAPAPPKLSRNTLYSLCLELSSEMARSGIEQDDLPDADLATAEELFQIANDRLAANVRRVDVGGEEATITPNPTSSLGKRIAKLEVQYGIMLSVPLLTPRSAQWLKDTLGAVLTPAKELVEV